jgi:hypothetical protein
METGETGETLFFIACDMSWLDCGKKREILEISKKCYFFIHFPILELLDAVARLNLDQCHSHGTTRTRPHNCPVADGTGTGSRSDWRGSKGIYLNIENVTGSGHRHDAASCCRLDLHRSRQKPVETAPAGDPRLPESVVFIFVGSLF